MVKGNLLKWILGNHLNFAKYLAITMQNAPGGPRVLETPKKEYHYLR